MLKVCSGHGLTGKCGGSVALYETAMQSSGGICASSAAGSRLQGYTRMMDMEAAAIVPSGGIAATSGEGSLYTRRLGLGDPRGEDLVVGRPLRGTKQHRRWPSGAKVSYGNPEVADADNPEALTEVKGSCLGGCLRGRSGAKDGIPEAVATGLIETPTMLSGRCLVGHVHAAAGPAVTRGNGKR